MRFERSKLNVFISQRPWVLTYLATLLSIAWFFLKTGTNIPVFEWNSNDMMLFFERTKNPTYLIGDFLTEATNHPGPRWIYGQMAVAFGSALNLEWYQTLHAWKLFFVVTLPPLLLQYVFNSLRSVTNRPITVLQSLVALFMVVGFINLNWIQRQFMVGDFAQISYQPLPQTASMFFGLLGSLAYHRLSPVMGTPLLALATLIHPTFGMALFFLHFVFVVRHLSWLSLGIYAFAIVVLPIVILLQLFPSTQPISAQEVYDIYIKLRHPHHYLFIQYDFVRLAKVMGWLSAFGIILTWKYRKRRDVSIASSSLWIGTFCILSVFSQWFFIEVLPVRQIMLLGPVRFMSLSSWPVAVLLTFVISEWLKQKPSFNPNAPLIQPQRFGLMSTIGLLLTIPIAGALAWSSYEDPKQKILAKHKRLIDWALTTNPNDSFVLPLTPESLEIQWLIQRPVVVSCIFPFSTDAMTEYGRRIHDVYGDPPSTKKAVGFFSAEREQFTGQYSPERIQKLVHNYNAKYLVVRAQNGRTSLPVLHSDPIWTVYDLRALPSTRPTEQN